MCAPTAARCLAAVLLCCALFPSRAAAQAPLGVNRVELFVRDPRFLADVDPARRNITFGSIQDALDSTDKPMVIYVDAEVTPGFTADKKDVQVAFKIPCVITNAVTFVDCNVAELRPNGGTWTARQLVAFVRSKNLYANRGLAENGMALQQCEDGVIECGINEGLEIANSTGITVGSCLIQGLGIAIADCTAATSRNQTARGNWPISVGGCTIQNIRHGPALFAYRSKVYAVQNTCIDLPFRGFEFQDCPDTWVINNQIKGANDIGIAYYDSNGLCETNTVNTNVKLNDGIYVVSSTPDKPNRSKVDIKQNTIGRADRGIVAISSTVHVFGNDANDSSLVGVAVGVGSDGNIDGAGVTNGQTYGIFVYQLMPGFRVEKTRLRTTATGIVVLDCKKITLFSNRWQSSGLRADAMVHPVTVTAAVIALSEVTLDYNSFHSKMSGPGMVIASSTVNCTNIDDVSSVTANEGYESAVTTTGPGIIISSSTVKGTLQSWTDDTALIVTDRSTLTLDTPAFTSIFAPAITIDGQSSLEGTGGVITGAQPRGQARAVQPTANDTVLVSGASRIKLTQTGLGNFGARATLHLTDRSSAVLENCQISGSRVGDQQANLLTTLRLFDGDYDGILVEGKDATAKITGGLLQLQAGDNVRARDGGHVSLDGVKLALGEHNVHVEAGGVVELNGCTLEEHQTYDPEKTGAGLRVDAGGTAAGKQNGFKKNSTALRVAKDGKLDLEGGSIANTVVGVRAQDGSHVALKGVQFQTVTTPVIGTITQTP